MIAAICDRGRPGLDVQGDLDHAFLEPTRVLEPGVVEDAQHRGVLWQHLRDERLDPGGGGMRRKPLEETRPDAPAVKLVGDRECDLCPPWIVETHVRGERNRANHAFRAGELAEQRAAARPVRLERGGDR